MKKTFLLLLLALIGCTATHVQAQNSNYIPPDTSTVQLSASIVLHQNLRYGPIPNATDVSSADRLLDIYLPATSGAKGLKPLFLFIHGGGFSGGDKGLKDLCSKIAAEGYVVASINYRLTLKNNKVAGAGCSANMAKGLPPSGSFHPLLQQAVLNASQDAALALVWLKQNAKKYQFNRRQVVVCGGSAGAMTALHLAYITKPKVAIKAVVNFWGGLEDATLIKKGSPPLLTYHGDLDDVIHIDYAYALDKRMSEIGSQTSKLNILKGKGHAQYKLIADAKIAEIAAFLKQQGIGN